MDVIEKLIKSLQEAKAELEKNMNCAPGYSGQNMDKAEAKKKKMPATPPKIESEDHPPKLSEAAAMKLVKEDEPHKDDPHHEEKEKKIASKIKAEASDLMDMHKEELTCSANGQWSLKKDASNPVYAPKDKKVRSLQHKIDSGTYKPDAGKIASAMIQHSKKPLNKFEEDLDKSVYNVGVSQANMPGRQSKSSSLSNFPHYDYDHSKPHEENVKQAKAHFDKHKVPMNDTRLQTYLKQQKEK